MTEPGLRETYLAWTRRALPVLLLPLALTAVVQAASASAWWESGPAAAGGMRYLFVAVAVASIMMGRTQRTRDVAARPLAADALLALSWRLLTFALSPVAIGAVLALMTRSVGDYYLLLLATLVALGILYPRFDQWVLWASEPKRRAE